MATAKKKVEEVVVQEVVVDATPVKEEVVKYRCDFASWEEFNKYKGAKG